MTMRGETGMMKAERIKEERKCLDIYLQLGSKRTVPEVARRSGVLEGRVRSWCYGKRWLKQAREYDELHAGDCIGDRVMGIADEAIGDILGRSGGILGTFPVGPILTLRDEKQACFLRALWYGAGNKSHACAKVGISRVTMRKWMEADADFGLALEEVTGALNDYVVSKLMSAIEKGESWAITLYLENRMAEEWNRQRFVKPAEFNTYLAMLVGQGRLMGGVDGVERDRIGEFSDAWAVEVLRIVEEVGGLAKEDGNGSEVEAVVDSADDSVYTAGADGEASGVDVIASA